MTSDACQDTTLCRDFKTGVNDRKMGGDSRVLVVHSDLGSIDKEAHELYERY